jgi:hypothetical protein
LGLIRFVFNNLYDFLRAKFRVAAGQTASAIVIIIISWPMGAGGFQYMTVLQRNIPIPPDLKNDL